MNKKNLLLFLDFMSFGVLGSFVGVVAGLVVALLIYGLDSFADFLFDFYSTDFYYSVPLVGGMMVGALLGAIFGSIFGLKKVK